MRFAMLGVSTLLYITITELAMRSKGFSNANLPSVAEQSLTSDEMSTYGFSAGLLAELLTEGQRFRN